MTPPLPDRIAAAIDNYRARCRTLDEADCYGSMDRASYDEQRKGVLDARDALNAAIAEVVAERDAERARADGLAEKLKEVSDDRSEMAWNLGGISTIACAESLCGYEPGRPLSLIHI